MNPAKRLWPCPFKILELPEELINHTLTYCGSRTLKQLRSTCRKIARIASPLLFSVVHIYPSRRRIRNFIALAATENFCQMVKHIVFYVQPLGNAASEDLHRVVRSFTNLESIIVTTRYRTWMSYYERVEEYTSFNYLLPVIKKAAACQRLQSLKINPGCDLFWLQQSNEGYWPPVSEEGVKLRYQEMGVAFISLRRLEITELRNEIYLVGRVAIFIQQLRKLEELEISYDSTAMLVNRAYTLDDDLPAQLQQKVSCPGLWRLKLALPTTQQSLTVFLEQFADSLQFLDIERVLFTCCVGPWRNKGPDEVFVAEISRRLSLCKSIKYEI